MATVRETSFVWFCYPYRCPAQPLPPAVNEAGPAWTPFDPFSSDGIDSEVLPHLKLGEELSVNRTRAWRVDPAWLAANWPGPDERWLLQGEQPIEWRVTDAELLWYNTGLCLLQLRVSVQSDRLEPWLEFLHFFRYGRHDGPHHRFNLAFQSRFDDRPVVPVGFGQPLDAEPCWQSQEVVGALLRSIHGDQPAGQSIFVPHRMLVYYGLFIDEYAGDELEFLARLRRFFRLNQTYTPAAAELSPSHPSLLPYAARCWHCAQSEGGGFVAFNPPEATFYRQRLPVLINGLYRLAFGQALHARLALMALSADLAQRSLGGAGGDCADPTDFDGYADLHGRWLSFTAQHHFVQAFQREVAQNSYAHWLSVFGVRDLFDEVQAEVRALYEEVSNRRRAHRNELAEQEASQRAGFETHLAVAALCLLFPTYVLGFFGMNIDAITAEGGLSPRAALGWAAGSVVLSLAAWAGYWLWSRRRRQTDPSHAA